MSDTVQVPADEKVKGGAGDDAVDVRKVKHATDAGTGDIYNHLRPEYLSDFVAGVESFWREVGRFTDAHLRYQRDTSDTKKPLFSFPVRSSNVAQVYENIGYESGALEGIRTPDPCLRRAVLYPAELRVRGGCP